MTEKVDLDKFGRIKLGDMLPDELKKQSPELVEELNNIHNIADDDPRLVQWRKNVENSENNTENK